MDGWKPIYKVAAVAALLIAGSALLDIILSFTGPAANVPGARTALDWFTLFQANWFLGLRDLGLLNMTNLVFTVPLFLATYAAHAPAAKPLAALAILVWVIGAAVYVANNTAFSMLALSNQYAAATTESQRTLLAAVAQAMLARGEDLTAGTFTGFFLTEAGAILLAAGLLRSRILTRWAAWAGMLGFSLLLLFNIGAAFAPSLYGPALTVATVGGPLVMLWYVLLALSLFRLGRPDSAALPATRTA